MADGMRKMFEPFEQVARGRHICPCCERPFSMEEEDNFVKKVSHPNFLLALCISIWLPNVNFMSLHVHKS